MKVSANKTLGILEWFHFGDYAHVVETLSILRKLNVRELRTGISWAEYVIPGGKEWISWLIKRLTKEMSVLPCLVYVPPKLSESGTTAGPPKNPGAYAKFVDEILALHGDKFQYIEIWNEPNNKIEWNFESDPTWSKFATMTNLAARIARKHKKISVLGGMSPLDSRWLSLMKFYGVLDAVDIVGIHAFPNTWDQKWSGWNCEIESAKKILESSGKKLWVTETGFSTYNGRENEQVFAFQEAFNADVERIYWYSLFDLSHQYKSTRELIEKVHDPHEHNMGIFFSNGKPKKLGSLFPLLTQAQTQNEITNL